MERPRLRYGLEMMPVQYQGRHMIVIRDSLGYCDKPLLVDAWAAPLLAGMDGTRTLRELQTNYVRNTGELLFLEKIEAMVRLLDECLLLENERFIQHVAREVASFRDSPVRRMRHAGSSYPAGKNEFRRMLEDLLHGVSIDSQLKAILRGKKIIGMVVPHIDIRVGGPTFAKAYLGASLGHRPSTWIVLGTSHQPLDHFFALTVKDFETPLGVVPCHRERAAFIRDKAPLDMEAGEDHHRMEHTIEFQAVFLAGIQPGSSIVPILCSFDVDQWRRKRDVIDETADVLRLCLDQGDVGIIASVDLAHIGPRYGDSFRPTRSTVARHLSCDRRILEPLLSCDPCSFMEDPVRERNERRICGLAPLYVMAKALEGMAQGVLLDHTYAEVDTVGSFVTFAGAVFHRDAGEREEGISIMLETQGETL